MENENLPEPIESKHFNLQKLKSIHVEVTVESEVGTEEEGVSKKRKMEDRVGEISNNNNKVIPCNKRIINLLNIIKMEILQLVEICNAVKIWIQLNIPRIEDGN